MPLELLIRSKRSKRLVGDGFSMLRSPRSARSARFLTVSYGFFSRSRGRLCSPTKSAEPVSQLQAADYLVFQHVSTFPCFKYLLQMLVDSLIGM